MMAASEPPNNKEQTNRRSVDSLLLAEYKQLSTAAENLVSNSFQVPAVAVAIVTALAISGNIHVHYVGFGVLIGMFLLSIWLGYYHSTLNTYGLHLVEIEQKINTRGDCEERLTYYTSHVGQAPLGTNVYAGLLGLLVFSSIGFSVWNIWMTTQSWAWRLGRYLCMIGFPLLTLVAFGNMLRTEKKVHMRKSEILRQNQSQKNVPAN